MKNQNKEKNNLAFIDFIKYFALLFFVLMSIFGLWFFAFYPGNLSPDSIVLYSQALTFGFDSLHPYLFSVFLNLLTRIWLSPAVLILFQTIVSALIGAYVFSLFIVKGLSKRMVLLLFILFATSIPVGLYNVTFWNDILYTQMIFLVSLIFVYYGLIKKKSIDIPFLLAFIILLTTLIASFRYNGVIYLLLVPVIFYLAKLFTKKQAFYALILATLLFVLQSTVLSTALKVDKSSGLLKEIPKAKIMGSVLKDGGKITPENSKILSQIAPKEVWANYVCYNDYSLFWNEGFNKKLFEDADYKKAWDKSFFATAIANPLAVVKDRACLDVYLLAGQNMNYLGVSENNLGISQKETRLNRFFSTVVEFSNKKPLRFLFWAPAIYLAIGGLFALLAYKKKAYWTLGFIFINFANVLLIFLVVSSAEFRYLYSSVFPVFFIPGFYFIETKAD